MFTGIIEEIGIVKAIGNNSLSIQGKLVLDGSKPGDSVAVNGACLTITEIAKDCFTVEVMPETKRLTNIGALRIGDTVNLERAMPAQGRFGGHFVQGHVDGTGKISSVGKDGESLIISIGVHEDIASYLVKKCFIAVDGISLTVTACSRTQFSVSVVGFTRQNTNLGKIKQGDVVNLEIDIIAKYIDKFYKPGKDKEQGMISLLNQYDYLKAR